jgi:hypothetical protein
MKMEHTFTDEQITDACEISQENLRKLIQWGAVRPLQSGGGRGKVRLWNFSQATRISVTAQFFNAGFSLKMAHTLAYALPLDDMLLAYDLDLWNDKSISEEDSFHKDLLDSEGTYFGYSERRIGHVIITKQKYVYCDALGDSPTIFGIIDKRRNIYITAKSHSTFYFGGIADLYEHVPRKVGMADISPETLAIEIVSHDEFNAKNGPASDVHTQLLCHNDYPSSFQIIALYMGLSSTIRKLLDLPVDKHPGFNEE